jgi:chromosome segregation ATPase
MPDIKNDITLEQVRAIMEKLARDEECCITQIEIQQTQAILGKGNNGTVGAYVKQVKHEFSKSKEYDRANISMQLKSMLMEEIDRFADNARDNANENLDTIERDNEELRHLNIQVHEANDELQKQIQALQDKTNTDLRIAAEDLAKAQERLASAQENQTTLTTNLESCRSDLKAANEENRRLSKESGRMEAEIEHFSSKATELSERVDKADRDREAALQKSALAEQAAALHKETIDRLEKQISTMESDMDELKKAMDSEKIKNGELQDKLDDLNIERINELRMGTGSQADTSPTQKSPKSKPKS